MTPPSTPSDTLRVGYSNGTKAAVGIAASAGWWVAYATGSPLPALPALAFTVLVFVTLRSRFEVTRSELRHITWKSTVVRPRSEFLGFETLDDSRGKPSLLLRFQSGVEMLSGSRGCSHPELVREYLEQTWVIAGSDRQRAPAGPVDEALLLEYEPLHLALLAFATIGLASLSAFGPMFWAAAIPAFLCGRTLYFTLSSRRIVADRNGISVTRPFQARLTISWARIVSVRYLYSPTQGCMVLSNGTDSIRVYRWIRDYPRFNRMVQDHAPAASFPSPPALPWTIALNRRRNGSWFVLLFAAGVSAWLWSEGAWPAALIFTGAPLLTFIFTSLASGRKVDITKDDLRLTERRNFAVTVQRFRRADLEDMRLGRQLSAGGLWMKFGNERLEIGNLDSDAPPQQVLAVLRREWQWEPAATRSEEFRAA